MSAIEIDLGIVHHFAGGIYAREMHLPAGHYAVSHAHVYTHLAVLAQGVADVQMDGQVKRFEAPAVLQIAQGVEHRITAITDICWLCVHATNETDPDRLDDVLIEKGN